MTWTPGPWRAEHKEWGWVVREDRDGPADYLMEHGSEADARLISLAPEMAELLAEVAIPTEDEYGMPLPAPAIPTEVFIARARDLLARAKAER